jgi:hypothetical protein
MPLLNSTLRPLNLSSNQPTAGDHRGIDWTLGDDLCALRR